MTVFVSFYSQSTLEHWEHFTRETLSEGEAVRQQSVTLRGTLDAVLTNAARDLREQADRVDLAFASRINCNEELRLKLENDLKIVSIILICKQIVFKDSAS